MEFLVAHSGWSVERIADHLSVILAGHIDPRLRRKIWPVSGCDKDMLLNGSMGPQRMAFLALSANRIGERTSL